MHAMARMTAPFFVYLAVVMFLARMAFGQGISPVVPTLQFPNYEWLQIQRGEHARYQYFEITAYNDNIPAGTTETVWNVQKCVATAATNVRTLFDNTFNGGPQVLYVNALTAGFESKKVRVLGAGPTAVGEFQEAEVTLNAIDSRTAVQVAGTWRAVNSLELIDGMGLATILVHNDPGAFGTPVDPPNDLFACIFPIEGKSHNGHFYIPTNFRGYLLRMNSGNQASTGTGIGRMHTYQPDFVGTANGTTLMFHSFGINVFKDSVHQQPGPDPIPGGTLIYLNVTSNSAGFAPYTVLHLLVERIAGP